MLHPRLPPLLRALPSLDTIALSSIDEGKDERETRESIGLRIGDDNTMQIDGSRSESIFKPQTGELQSATSVAEPEVSSLIPSADPPTARATSVLPISINPHIPSQETFAPIPSANSSKTPLPSKSLSMTSGNYEVVLLDRLAIPEGRPEQNTPQKVNTPDSAAAMAVDDEDDGEIEVPTLDMDSDSEPEE